MEWGLAHEFKNLEWNGDLPMSLRTWNGMGDLPMSLRTRNGNLPTSSCNSKWKKELASKFFNSKWNGNFPINKFPMNFLLAPQILNS